LDFTPQNGEEVLYIQEEFVLHAGMVSILKERPDQQKLPVVLFTNGPR